ncbi:AraC family transcriptional regulator [Pleomorphomonas carboxyditropha]|uniref:AraC family transcriptional regulator n=1 Tax=Pleomorphomonas carboxyditropha TaxID=2023338 RepID=UPI0013FDD024|nr:AraC family transcriptional regulator [Pleomorphomonas carboxyditropha]
MSAVPVPSSRADGNQVLTRRALRTKGVRLLDGGRQGDEVVACGLVGAVRMDCGVYANFGRRMQISDLEMEVALKEEVSIKIFLEGHVEASIDGEPIPMPRRTAQGRWQPSAIVVSHPQGARLRRKARKGQYLDKMVIGLPRDWLRRWQGFADTPQGFKALIEGRPGLWRWQPSARAEFLIRQMFDIAARKPPFATMQLESNTLAIIAEALSDTFGSGADAVASSGNLTATEQQRLYALVKCIDRRPGCELCVTDIVGELATSPATLQRLVRKAHNCSLAEFIRNKYLDDARQALMFSDRSISDIAFAAGYTHLSNFTAAFRRRFGHPPSQLRRPGSLTGHSTEAGV